jgi:acetyltransferase-like isoleucine patch superfamily enzyme
VPANAIVVGNPGKVVRLLKPDRDSGVQTEGPGRR